MEGDISKSTQKRPILFTITVLVSMLSTLAWPLFVANADHTDCNFLLLCGFPIYAITMSYIAYRYYPKSILFSILILLLLWFSIGVMLIL